MENLNRLTVTRLSLVNTLKQYCYTHHDFDSRKAERLEKSDEYWSECEILVSIASMISEGSDEPAHTRSLARALASRVHKVWNLMKTLTRRYF